METLTILAYTKIIFVSITKYSLSSDEKHWKSTGIFHESDMSTLI